jgi:molybdate transport system substrate-binding protein
MKLQHALLAAVVTFSLAGSAWAQVEGRVTILVDGSAQNLVKALGDKFQADTNNRVRITAGATPALAAQISKGGPADMFLGIGEDVAEALKKENKVAKSAPLLTNALVLIVQKNSSAGVKSIEDLSSDKVKKVALADEQTPEGKCAQQALTAAGAFAPLTKKIIRTPDGRTAAANVERGEAQAAVAYSTDAQNDQLAVVYTFDGASHDKIVYSVVLTNRGDKNPNAQKFYDFLLSKDADEIYEKFGFTRLEN